MTSLKQFISFILIFQLCFACTGGGGSSGGVIQAGGGSDSSSETISVQGTFAKAFKSLGNMLVDSAIAQDGTIELLDLSNPQAPKSLGTFDVENESKGFSFKIKSPAIKGKVIFLYYEGGAGSTIRSRSMILEVDENPTDVVIDEMNADSTVQSQVLLTRLQEESVVTLSDVKKRFKELHQHKEKILEQIKELSLSSLDLNDYIKGPNNSLAVALAAIWLAGIDGDDALKQEALNKFNYIASKEAPDLVGKNGLTCDGTDAKFSSQSEGSFKVLATALTVELQEKFGSKEFEIGIGVTSDEVNQHIAKTIEHLKEVSKSFKEIQIIAIHVLNEKNAFSESCKVKSRLESDGEVISSDYFDLEKILSYTAPDGITFREMTNVLWSIYHEIRKAGEAKIQAAVESGNLEQDAAKNRLHDELVKELEVFNTTYDKLNETHNPSKYKIDVTKLRGFTCSSFETLDQSEIALREIEQGTYQGYIDTFGNSDNDDFYSQIDLLKQTVESQRVICTIYFN
jgi:hypothetical protein